MTTTYTSSSCNSENIYSCMLLVISEGLLHACISSIYINELPSCLTHSQPSMYSTQMTQMLDTFASNNISGIDYKLNEDLDNVN